MKFPDPAQLDWIFFDFDGTLWDHPAALRASLRQLCAEMGFEYEPFLDSFRKQGSELWDAVVRGEIDIPTMRLRRIENVLRAMGTETDPERVRELSERYLFIYRHYRGEYEATAEVMRAAAQRARLAILTNAPSDTQSVKIGLLDEAERLDFVLTTDRAKCVKTDPDFYVIAEQMAGSPSPDRVLYVGDSWRDDIAPAQPRGWWCVWINENNEPMPEPLERVYVIRHIGELLPLLTGTESVALEGRSYDPREAAK